MNTISYIKDFQKWKAEFSFHIEIKIRFSETDMFGHVNNISPFIYFEEARIEFLKKAGLTLSEGERDGIPVVADLQCDYHQQFFFNDLIKVYVKVNHIGNSSIDVHYMVLNEQDQLCLTGRGALVYVDPKNGKPIPIPSEMKHQFMTQNNNH